MTKATIKAAVKRTARKAARRTATKKSSTSVASHLPRIPREKTKAAKRKFERGVIARGEAVPEGTPLPRGATHEIVGTDAEGNPVLKRKRFSVR